MSKKNEYTYDDDDDEKFNGILFISYYYPTVRRVYDSQSWLSIEAQYKTEFRLTLSKTKLIRMSKRSRACVFTQFHSMFGCSASVCDRFASVNLLAVVEPEPTEMTTTTTNVLHSTHFTENSVLRIFGSLHRTNRSHLSCVTLGPYHLTYNTPLL